MPDPSPGAVRMIVNAFLVHADQIAFFLHRTRFFSMMQMTIQSSAAQMAPLSPALTNAVCLWGALKTPLVNMPASTIIHTIQANVLLANYHFATGRMLEGQHYCNAAVALTLSSRLYSIRTMQDQQRSGSFHAMEFDLSPPNDAIEEGERIRAFWHASTGPPIDTPWPMEADDYASGRFPPHIRGSRTVDDFIRGNPQNDRGALDAINPTQVAFVNPIFAILWTTVSRALVAEMVRLRGLWASATVQIGLPSPETNCRSLKRHARLSRSGEDYHDDVGLQSRLPTHGNSSRKVEQMVAQAG
ncbi:uncharacterized protein B0H18DRAFT_1120793 [Fomitopsis serialis]|uniref:uncharacterized protein n=1 Tax=Fomitopsis serialis TaxID=139415 RepID=UPI002007A7CA|nr:uncharacterized protein B0H18DRAFT_1120793 [Neoantrodia serialis]KAH9922617.1 hypothetical protein B0H18DRAFT_1120793 [Neoantrodia serialis]